MTVSVVVCRSAALLAAAAGVIHLAAAGDHLEHPAAATFFVVAGALQLVWAAGLVRRPGRTWLLAGAAGSLMIVALWIVSRTAGVPLVFGGEGVEPFGIADTVASLLELLVAAAAGLAAVLPDEAAGAPMAPAAAERATAGAGALAFLLLVPALVTAPPHAHGETHDDGHGDLAAHTATAVHDGDEHGHADTKAGAAAHARESAVMGVQHAHAGAVAGSAAHAHRGGTAAVAGAHDHGAGGHDNAAGAVAGHAHDAGCTPTIAERAQADKLVADTVQGLQKYTDNMAALADAYLPFPPTPSNWTQHYVDFAALDDDAILDPEKPESLLYAQTDDGYRPISALYIMSHAGDQPPPLGGCLLQWHKHDELFLSRPGESGSPLMLHVFVVPMKGGPFAHDADPRSVRELWQPFRDYINPWWQDSCFGLPLLPGDPFGSLPFCDTGAH
jgi:hypothetical protein